MNFGNFFAELKRRKVYKVAVAYAVIAWLLIQAASIGNPKIRPERLIESEFGVTIGMRDQLELTSYDAIRRYVAEHNGGNGASA